VELTLNLPHGDQRIAMIGAAERNLKIIRESLGVTIWSRNGALRITGDSRAVGQAAQVLEQLAAAARGRQALTREQVLDAVALAGRRPAHASAGAGGHAAGPAAEEGMDVYARGRRIRALTAGQRAYLQALEANDLTICTGPAGTGKTYLAVAAAVSMLKHGRVRKLVLVRPAVEAGERLGFLPGDLQQKVNPYLRPLLDALHDMMDFEQIQRFLACDLIEIVPLAFMRGRTLNDALIILDEAQNTTRLQMLMFLTRLGHGGKMVVAGDPSQIDLPDPRESGLIDAVRRLRRVGGVATVTLDRVDIVRHNLVQRIVEAYAPLRAAKDRRAAAEDGPGLQAETAAAADNGIGPGGGAAGTQETD
jgi:phosphate starvation-inducible PhoH-like protein